MCRFLKYSEQLLEQVVYRLSMNLALLFAHSPTIFLQLSFSTLQNHALELQMLGYPGSSGVKTLLSIQVHHQLYYKEWLLESDLEMEYCSALWVALAFHQKG